MSDKELLRQAILAQLGDELKTATIAADAAKDTATSDETIAENKYDTFGLEASYLAHGQSQRAADILQAIHFYRNLPFKIFTDDDPISISAVVVLEDTVGQPKCFFVGPYAGGLKAHWRDQEIMVITPQTPLGKQLIGCHIGDRVKLVINNQQTIFDVTAVD